MKKTIFDALTESPSKLGGFLRTLPVIEAPWDDEFHKRYCKKCLSPDCNYCPYEKYRNNPEWWLLLKAKGAAQ